MPDRDRRQDFPSNQPHHSDAVITLDQAKEERLALNLRSVSPASEHRARKAHRARQETERLLTRVNARSPHDLRVLLANKIAFQRPVVGRQRTRLARLINRLTVDQVGRIELQGLEILSVYRLLGREPDQRIEPYAPYLIDFEVAVALHRGLERGLSRRPAAS